MRIIFFICLSVWALSARGDVLAKDALGNEIHLSHPAKRIISLAPHTTELLYGAGADQQVVGAVNFSDYPPKAKNLPRVGSYNRLNLEAILALKPDLIVAWKSGNPEEALAYLEKIGLPIFYSEPRSLQAISQEIRQLGKLLAREEIANSLADDFDRRLKRLQQQYGGKSRVRLFYQVWNQPLMTINDQHLISDVIRLCGGENVFASLPVLAPRVDIEAVIKAAPEIIIAGIAEGRENWLSGWEKWPVIPAVKKHQLYGINADLIVRHTPRILLGAEKMCHYIDQARHHK